MRARSDAVTLIAIYHFVSGLLNLLVVCGVMSVPLIVGLAAGSSGDPDAGTATAITSVVGVVAGGIFVILGAANFVVGWGLWQRREWARLGAMGLAIVRLINIPLGTIVGGFIIWYLLQPTAKAEFAEV